MSTQHYKPLDGIRGIAIILVLLFHVNFYFKADGLFQSVMDKIFAAGWTGVDLFFVLSGFLITRILLNSRTSPGYFKNFYMRRVLRIFPLYYFMIILSFLVLPYVISTAELPGFDKLLENQYWFWIYLQNFANLQFNNFEPANFLAHTWSLAIEEQFYLLWPLIVWRFDAVKLKKFCLGILVFSFLTRFYFYAVNAPLAAMLYNTMAHIDTLAAGSWVACTVTLGTLSEDMRIGTQRIVTVLAVIVAGHWLFQQKLFVEPKITYVYGSTVLALLFAGLIHLTVETKTSFANRILESTPLVFFGKYSYAIYVFHWPVLFFLIRSEKFRAFLGEYSFSSFLVLMAVYIAVTVILALISWNVLERPFLKLKERFQ